MAALDVIFSPKIFTLKCLFYNYIVIYCALLHYLNIDIIMNNFLYYTYENYIFFKDCFGRYNVNQASLNEISNASSDVFREKTTTKYCCYKTLPIPQRKL